MTMWPWFKAHLLYTWGGLHRYFGNANGVRREYQRAVHYFSRAYQTDPTFHQALLARAVLRYRELGEIEAALADLTALLQADPENMAARFNRALAYQESGRYHEALTDLHVYLAHAGPGEAHYESVQRMASLLYDLLGD